MTKTFPTYVSPKVSPKKTIARYCITQENRPLAVDETFPNYVSPKKTGPWTRYHPRKQLLATVSPKKTGHLHLTKHFPPTYHPRYHPRKQLLATVSLKKTGHWHLMKHFPTRYHPRKRVLYTVSPKKTIAGYCITQENRPPALDETFPTYVSPKKMGRLDTVSPKKTIARYCITQDYRPPALDETF